MHSYRKTEIKIHKKKHYFTLTMFESLKEASGLLGEDVALRMLNHTFSLQQRDDARASIIAKGRG